MAGSSNAKDGVNADFAWSKNLHSRRRLSIEQPHPLRSRHCQNGVLHIEKLDNES